MPNSLFNLEYYGKKKNSNFLIDLKKKKKNLTRRKYFFRSSKILNSISCVILSYIIQCQKHDIVRSENYMLCVPFG